MSGREHQMMIMPLQLEMEQNLAVIAALDEGLDRIGSQSELRLIFGSTATKMLSSSGLVLPVINGILRQVTEERIVINATSLMWMDPLPDKELPHLMQFPIRRFRLISDAGYDPDPRLLVTLSPFRDADSDTGREATVLQLVHRSLVNSEFPDPLGAVFQLYSGMRVRSDSSRAGKVQHPDVYDHLSSIADSTAEMLIAGAPLDWAAEVVVSEMQQYLPDLTWVSDP